MTGTDLVRVMAMISLRWPHHPLPPGAEMVWADDLQALPYEVVQSCIRDYARCGNAFPPSSGQVYATVIDMTDTAPDFGEAWAEIRRVACMKTDTQQGYFWSHPVVAEAARQIGLHKVGNAQIGDTTVESQARGIYNDVRTRHHEYQRGRVQGQALLAEAPALQVLNLPGPGAVPRLHGDVSQDRAQWTEMLLQELAQRGRELALSAV